MCMFRRADDHRVDVLCLIVKLAEINELASLRMFLCRAVQGVFINITERHDVFTADALQVRGAAPAGTDDSDVELFIEILGAKKYRRGQEERARAGRPFQEAAARHTSRGRNRHCDHALWSKSLREGTQADSCVPGAR